MSEVSRNRERIIYVIAKKPFLMGKLAQCKGNYFASLGKEEEAEEEYLAAIDAYDRVLPYSPDFSKAQNNKETVRKILYKQELQQSLSRDEVEQSESEILFISRTSQEQEDFAKSLYKFCREEGFSWVDKFEILKIIKDGFSGTKNSVELAFRELLYPDSEYTLIPVKSANLSNNDTDVQSQDEEESKLISNVVDKLITFYEGEVQ